MDITNKIDAVTKIGEDRIAMGGIQAPPKSVKIELTARCNLVCKFCALRTRQGPPPPDMPLEYFKRITTDMRMSGVEEIGLFYLGESFMAPDLLIAATEWCKKLGFPWVFLTSNAVNAKATYVEGVLDAGLDSLKWSVNSGDAAEFLYNTGGSAAMFEKTKTNIRTAHGIRETMGVKTILSASSILYDDDQPKRMEDFLSAYVKPYVDRHYWLPMYSMSMWVNKVKEEFGYTPTVGNMGRIDDNTGLPNRPPLPCWAAFTEGHVRVDGGLSACCFGADARFDMGKLDGSNFMMQWNSPAFRRLREAQIRTLKDGPTALENTPCKVCVAYGE